MFLVVSHRFEQTISRGPWTLDSAFSRCWYTGIPRQLLCQVRESWVLDYSYIKIIFQIEICFANLTYVLYLLIFLNFSLFFDSHLHFVLYQSHAVSPTSRCTGCRCTTRLRLRCFGSCRAFRRQAWTACSAAVPCSSSAPTPTRVCSASAPVATPLSRCPLSTLPPPLPRPASLYQLWQHRHLCPLPKLLVLKWTRQLVFLDAIPSSLVEPPRTRAHTRVHLRPLTMLHSLLLRKHWTQRRPLPTIAPPNPRALSALSLPPPPTLPPHPHPRPQPHTPAHRHACCWTSAPATATWRAAWRRCSTRCTRRRAAVPCAGGCRAPASACSASTTGSVRARATRSSRAWTFSTAARGPSRCCAPSASAFFASPMPTLPLLPLRVPLAPLRVPPLLHRRRLALMRASGACCWRWCCRSRSTSRPAARTSPTSVSCCEVLASFACSLLVLLLLLTRLCVLWSRCFETRHSSALHSLHVTSDRYMTSRQVSVLSVILLVSQVLSH